MAAATTGLAVIVYGAVQQDLRLTADDPQVALAQRTAAQLDAGTPAAAVLPAERVDLARSLDPFVLVFDANGHMLASSATLHSQVLDYPVGVFDTVRASGEDRVTWQPENGVRSATVAVAWQGGFVVAGRSLRLTEQHVDQIRLLVGAGWLATLGLLAAAAVLATLVRYSDDRYRPGLGAPA
jgi:hypothetical protein